MSAEDARIRIERAPNRCPYCHDTVRTGEEEWVACAECLARHHVECWSDVAPARCAACGGEASLEPRGPRRSATAPARPQLRIDPDQLAATARQLATNARGQVAGTTTRDAATEPYYGSTPWVFGKLLVALGIGAALYHALMKAGIGQTSALFVGLPALLAIVMLVTPAPRTTTGTVLKTITLLLAISGLIFAEGLVCILMAAPLFLCSGLLAAKLWDWTQAKDVRPVVAAPLLLFMSLEGTTPALTLPREEVVTAERVVEGTPADVERRLAARPRFATPPPFALALGFPNPTWTRGEGLAPGDERVVHLVGGEGHPGDLVLRVEASGPGFARFDVVSDTSHMPHYLDWEGSEVRWEAVDDQRTRVRWSLRYTRRLDPAWYFAPCERWAAGLAVGWLVDALASPAQDRADAGVPERAP